MLALDRNGQLEQTAEKMTEACDQVASGEITIATRSVVLDGVAVEEGQIIGVVDGRLRASGPDIDEVLQTVLEEMEIDDRELVSIYYGSEVSLADAEQVATKVQGLHPEVEVEVLAGGQTIYQYIIGAE